MPNMQGLLLFGYTVQCSESAVMSRELLQASCSKDMGTCTVHAGGRWNLSSSPCLCRLAGQKARIHMQAARGTRADNASTS